MANDVAVQENEVKYVVDGREVKLTASLVRKYLVRGSGNVTLQEMALFMGICRARGMDPWAGDVYVIKYGDKDPAAIVTAIDFVRARARVQPDCQGWTCGIIVERDGQAVDSSGLLLKGDALLGGWAECQPKGWEKPVRLEVNLSGYIKKTSTGEITKFWKPENQPTMIMKVAEMQILRRIWPAAAGKMYLAEEVGGPTMPEGLDIDMQPEGTNGATWEEKREQPEETAEMKFLRLAGVENGIEGKALADLKSFITASAKATKKTEDDLMLAACSDFPAFLKIYQKHVAKRAQKEKEKAEIESKTKAAAEKKTEPKGAEIGSAKGGTVAEKLKEEVNKATGEVSFPGPFDEPEAKRDTAETKDCPEDGEPRSYGWCRAECPTFQDCLNWGK